MAAIYDIGSAQAQLYYAMEYVRGPVLAAHVRRQGPYSEPQTIALAKGLLEALVAVSRAGLVHRDIKPANVILRGGKVTQPVLVDFGLAKRPSDRSLTPGDMLMGTPGYFPPEVISGQEPDHRSDLFSLGLVLRYALEGDHLYPDLQGLELVRAMVDAPVPPPSRPVSSRLARFFGSLLERRPRRRPESAQVALEALLEIEELDTPTDRVLKTGIE